MGYYEILLDVPDGQERPDYFQLLGVSRQETDPDVIKAAATRQTKKLRQHLGGPHESAARKLAGEIKRAYQVLSQPAHRARYLANLEQQQRQKSPPTPSTNRPSAETSAPLETDTGKTKLLIVGVTVLAFTIIGLGTAAYLVLRNQATAIASSDSIATPDVPLPAEASDAGSSTEQLTGSSANPALVNELSVVASDKVPSLPSEGQALLRSIADGNSDSPSELPLRPEVATGDLPGASSLAVEKSAVDSEQKQLSLPSQQASPPDRGDSGGDLSAEQAGSNESNQNHDRHTVIDKADLAEAAKSVLERNCFRCHGENETDEGGFNFALSREKLISSGFVIPNNTAESVLVDRLVSLDTPMPPEGESPRPDSNEIQIIKDWIQAGARPFADSAPLPMIKTDDMYRLIAADLNRVSKKDRVYARYFSVTHLQNSGYTKEETQIYELGLAKLLNSISWNRQLASLSVVGGLSTVYRVDLRDLKWTDQTWATILESYPFGLLHETNEAMQVRTETKCDVPVVRADWFVSEASRPPLYHVLAQIPETDQQLEQLLQIDVNRNLKEHRVVRAGFARSGVSQHNRLIERHESIFGAYWKSYDFAGSTGQKNLFDYPMGPGDTASDFDHDGGEIIFQLPNGMLAYMLTDAVGRRIDQGPTNIVSDPRQPDRAVVNGLSCMSCHYGGFIQKTDELRSHVIANRVAFTRADEILNLYREPEETTQLIARDTQAYLKALSSDAIGIAQPTRAGEPIVLAALRYNNELDLPLAAAELGVDPEMLRTQLSELSDPALSRRIGVLTTKGGVVKRDTFVNAFSKLAGVLDAGKVVSAKPAPAIAAAATPPVSTRVDIGSLRFGRDRVAAERALATAGRMMNSTQWRDAGQHFENAIRLANTPAFRLRACENAIAFYERSQAIDPLLSAHKYILDSCRSAFEIDRARNQLFQSLRKVVNGSIPRSSDEIDWPISITRAIAATFTPALAKEPNHEPTLRVLQTFYRDIQEDAEKRKVILERLAGILRARGEVLEHASGIDLAELLIESGEAERGAMIIAHYVGSVSGTQAAMLLYREANAWIDAGDKSKAMVALKRAQKLWQLDRGTIAASQLGLIGDAFMELDERGRAIDAYKLAVQLEKGSSNLRRLQQKLAAAAVGQTAQPAGDANTVEDLLDPNRMFRIDAERLEHSSSSSPSSLVSNMMSAAENWIKAGEKERATSALNKAAVANRRVDASSAERNHARLAELYRLADQHQKAIDQWVLALKSTTRETSIEQYQTQIDLTIQEDPSSKVDPGDAPLMDSRYKLRVQAEQMESNRAYDASSRVMNLTRAADYWQQADDTQEALRCLSRAESTIKQVKSQSPYPPEAEMHRKLADLYKKLGRPEEEVKNLHSAMKFAHSDDHVVRDHQRIKAICETHSIPQPELDPSVAERLDPLNRFRVQAAKDEEKATGNPVTASTFFRSAINNWIKANEPEAAIRAANQWARLVMKDDTSSRFEYDCMTLGDMFTELDQKPAAVKCYEEAMRVTKYESRKRQIKQKLDELKGSDE